MPGTSTVTKPVTKTVAAKAQKSTTSQIPTKHQVQIMVTNPTIAWICIKKGRFLQGMKCFKMYIAGEMWQNLKHIFLKNA